jgi:hypothetical protein
LDHRLRGLLGFLLPFGELSLTTLTILSSVTLEMSLLYPTFFYVPILILAAPNVLVSNTI